MGIVFAFYKEANAYFIFPSIIVLTVFLFLSRFNYRYRFGNGVIFILLFFMLGAMLTETKKHEALPVTKGVFLGSVKEHVVRNGKVRAEVMLDMVRTDNFVSQCKRRVLVYFPDDQLNIEWDDRICFTGEMQKVPGMKNPGQFDWRAYLSIKRIDEQIFLRAGTFRILPHKHFSVRRSAESIRNSLLSVFDRFEMLPASRAVISALVLGYDDEIDAGLMKDFAATGTLHILSVSGMHVAIVYTALSFLLRFMEKRRKLRLKRIVILATFIWLYALITGFSPSVIRSAMMFTIILVASGFKRTSNIYNSIMAAVVVICVLIDPLLILYPGFQLSIVAVLGIVYLYPLIYAWFEPGGKILNFTWSLIAVSLAAQLATLPVTLFYFGQFPNYFLLGNLLILPLSTLIIFGGIALLFLFPLQWFAVKLAALMNLLTEWMCSIAKIIGALPLAVTDELYINGVELIILYLLILFVVLFLQYRMLRYLQYSGILVIIFLLGLIISNIKAFERKNLIVFHDRKKIVSGYLNGHLLVIFHSGDSASAEMLAKGYAQTRGSVFEKQFVDLSQLKEFEFFQSGKWIASSSLILAGKTLISLNGTRYETDIQITHYKRKVILIDRSKGAEGRIDSCYYETKL